MNIVHEQKGCGHIEFWSRHRLTEKARISWILHGANNLMSILYAPKLFLTNQNFANILETSIKVLLYQKIAKNWTKCNKLLSCCLGEFANWISVKIKFAIRLERIWIAEKMIKYVRKSPCERVEIKENLNDKEFMISDVLPSLPDISLHLYIFKTIWETRYFWYIMQ